MNKPRRPLAPDEVLRVMDAAQVIHERQAALREHEELDREATIRDIQIMYEELGDLVDTRVIEKALDEYMAQRYAFTPAPAGFGKRLALLYIRRGWVTKRVLLPAAGIAAVVWGGLAGIGLLQQGALERDAERLRAEVAGLEAARETGLSEIATLLERDKPPDLPPADVEAFNTGLASAERRLGEVVTTLAPVAEEASGDGLTRAAIDGLRRRVEFVESDLGLAGGEISAAGAVLERHARLGTIEPEISGLHAAVQTEAVEELARERAAVLRRSADAQLAARDVDGLEETARSYRQLLGQVGSEYEIVIVGGVWRFHTELDGVRNYYLMVQAIAADGSKVPVVIRNEENGNTTEVTEWAERVPKEVYDRVGADKQDNGIIDDDDFGFKRRGFVTAERNYENLGQITEW